MNQDKILRRERSNVLSKILCGILCTTAISLSTASAQAQGSWEHFTLENSSLPCDSVRSIAVDSTGNVWVATYSRTSQQGVFADAGISRFDGTEWYSELDGTTAVWGLSTTPNGVLYAILFPNGELPKLWGRKGEWAPVPTDQQSTSISETVISRDGSLFGWQTGFTEPWFFFYASDPATGEPGGTEYESWLPAIGEGNYSVSTGTVDGNNTLWIIADQYEWVGNTYGRKGTSSALLSLSLDSPGAGWKGVDLGRTVTAVAGGRNDVLGCAVTDGFLIHAGTVSDQNWRAIDGITSAQQVAQDQKGNFWIIGTAAQSGTEERLLYYDVAKARVNNLAPIPYSASLITEIVPDTKGNLWIGYNGNGLSLYHSETSEVVEDRSAGKSLNVSVVPNPARGGSELHFVFPGPTEVVVEVYDRLGRLVETIYRGEVEGGRRRFTWSGTETPGQYYYRVSSRFGRVTAKFIQVGK